MLVNDAIAEIWGEKKKKIADPDSRELHEIWQM
jgi:hypothetical protein